MARPTESASSASCSGSSAEVLDPAGVRAVQAQPCLLPAFAVPGAMDALMALGKAVDATGLPEATRELVHLRASQINGCGVCLVGHARIARRAGETEERIWAVAGWRDAPYFDAAERAALALAEAITRPADRDGVPDDVWDEAAAHVDEPQLAALVLTICSVNLWNGMNVTTRQVAGKER